MVLPVVLHRCIFLVRAFPSPAVVSIQMECELFYQCCLRWGGPAGLCYGRLAVVSDVDDEGFALNVDNELRGSAVL
jgi:hypothetical protein